MIALRLYLAVSLLFGGLVNKKTSPENTLINALKEVPFTILSKAHSKYQLTTYARPALLEKNCIIYLVPELNGLQGIRNSTKGAADLELNLDRSANILFAVSQAGGRKVDGSSLFIKNAVTVSGLPPVDIYIKKFAKGKAKFAAADNYMIVGVVDAGQKIETRDAALPDGRYWKPFIVEGFEGVKPLFEVIGGPDKPVIDSGMPGTETIQGGFEGGACVKVNSVYHMFPTERAGEKGVPAYYDRVKTNIGHWTSVDGVNWKRDSAIYRSNGKYSITHDDNPLNERRAAIWSYMPVFSEKANRWYGYYLAYTVDKDISPNHSFGRIWRCESVVPGKEGIGGPYRDLGIIMEPGFDSQLWEGRQGVDSFFPYETKDGWLAFYGGAYPYEKREDYPAKMGSGWYVGLARSASLEGPWTRMDESINPVRSMHPTFIENPIVYQLPGGRFITIFDGGPEGWGHHLPNMMGYALSKDGIHWDEAHYIPFDTHVKKWWHIMRTPVCLIPEQDDKYTVLYAAIDTTKRFHPMGKITLKLNREVLND